MPSEERDTLQWSCNFIVTEISRVYSIIWHNVVSFNGAVTLSLQKFLTMCADKSNLMFASMEL